MLCLLAALRWEPKGGAPSADLNWEEIPPYGAALLFELHRDQATGTKFVRLVYQAGPAAEYQVDAPTFYCSCFSFLFHVLSNLDNSPSVLLVDYLHYYKRQMKRPHFALGMSTTQADPHDCTVNMSDRSARGLESRTFLGSEANHLAVNI